MQWEWLSRPYNHAVMTSYHFLWNDFTNYIMQQATFWRRRVRERIGDFDPTFHFAMDAEYWIRAGAAGLRLRHLPEKLGKFRMIEGTKSLSSPTVFWEDYLEIFRRYQGSGALGDFFAFYYYNLARQFDGDLLQAIKEGARVFERWQDLPESERAALGRDARRGQASCAGARSRVTYSAPARRPKRLRCCAKRLRSGRGWPCALPPSECCSGGCLVAAGRGPRSLRRREPSGAIGGRASTIGMRVAAEATSSAARVPAVSVIIPTCRRPQMLLDCVASILRNDFQDFEIIIVDQDRERTLQAELGRRFNGDGRTRLPHPGRGRAPAAPAISRSGTRAGTSWSSPTTTSRWSQIGFAPTWTPSMPAAREPIVVGGRLDPLWLAPRPHWLPESKE